MKYARHEADLKTRPLEQARNVAPLVEQDDSVALNTSASKFARSFQTSDADWTHTHRDANTKSASCRRFPRTAHALIQLLRATPSVSSK